MNSPPIYQTQLPDVPVARDCSTAAVLLPPARALLTACSRSLQQYPAILSDRRRPVRGEIICVQEDAKGGGGAEAEAGVERQVGGQQCRLKRDTARRAAPAGEHRGIQPVLEHLRGVRAEGGDQ